MSCTGDLCVTQQGYNLREEQKRGPGTARLDRIFDKYPKRLANPSDEFSPYTRHVDHPPSKEIEDAIREWRPGLLKNDEYTPAFEPFLTVAGKRLLRWSNHMLETQNVGAGYIAGSMSLADPKTDLGDGRIFSVLHRACPSTRAALFERQDAKRKAKGVDKKSTALSPTLSELVSAESTYSEVKRAKVLCHELHLLPMSRHVDSFLMTGVKDPPTPEEIAKHEKRMARLAAREKESGIIVHVMSRYMGMRIHVHDTKDRVKFSLLAELLSRYRGGGLAPTAADVEERMMDKLTSCRDRWKEGRGLFEHLVNVEPPVSKTDDELIELAQALEAHFARAHRIVEWCSESMVACLRDRAAWRSWRDELTFVQWQSVCTTVLSRKVKVEEDVDDGSFTTIDPLQLMGSVFRRLKIHDPDDPEHTRQREHALEEIVKYLKSRIRDLKRIFQYYAAAEEGDANTMDHCEYWKFVRECKLQKDRRMLPQRSGWTFVFRRQTWITQRRARSGSSRTTGSWRALNGLKFWCGCAAGDFRKSPRSWTASFWKMMQEWVLEYACQVDIDVFRERLAGDKVQEQLKKNKRNLKGGGGGGGGGAFIPWYAADDDSDEGMMGGGGDHHEL